MFNAVITKLSTSKLSPYYLGRAWLYHITVKFNGKELGISGPEGLKEANAEDGYIILNNNRKLCGNVEIIEEAPF